MYVFMYICMQKLLDNLYSVHISSNWTVYRSPNPIKTAATPSTLHSANKRSALAKAPTAVRIAATRTAYLHHFIDS